MKTKHEDNRESESERNKKRQLDALKRNFSAFKHAKDEKTLEAARTELNALINPSNATNEWLIECKRLEKKQRLVSQR